MLTQSNIWLPTHGGRSCSPITWRSCSRLEPTCLPAARGVRGVRERACGGACERSWVAKDSQTEVSVSTLAFSAGYMSHGAVFGYMSHGAVLEGVGPGAHLAPRPGPAKDPSEVHNLLQLLHCSAICNADRLQNWDRQYPEAPAFFCRDL